MCFVSAVERCEKGRGTAGSRGRVSPCVCVCVCAGACLCVCVQNPDCQCRTTLQVKQCRIIRDTEGQRGGVGEVRKEGDGQRERGSRGER